MNAIIQFLLNTVPGFFRPAVGWLLEGLRRIIAGITGVWNWLGVSVNRWHTTVVTLATRMASFARIVHTGLIWLKNVAIPYAINVARNSIVSFVRFIDRELRAVITAGLSTLQRWADAAINAARKIIDGVQAFAQHWIGQIRATLDTLIRAIQPLLGGPARLADWLIGAMLDALARHVRANLERIVIWVLRTSPQFTLWLARELETLLLRILR